MSQRHLIASQVLNFRLGPDVPQHGVHERMRAAFSRVGVPALERVFSTLCGRDEVIRLERLEIDLGLVVGDEFEDAFGDDFADQVRARLRNAMRQVPHRDLVASAEDDKRAQTAQASASRRQTVGDARAGAAGIAFADVPEFVLHFLETGSALWWSMAGLNGEPEQATAIGSQAARWFNEHADFRATLYRTMRRDPARVLQRISSETWLIPLALAVTGRAPVVTGVPANERISASRIPSAVFETLSSSLDSSLHTLAAGIVAGTLADTSIVSETPPPQSGMTKADSARVTGTQRRPAAPNDAPIDTPSLTDEASSSKSLFVESAGLVLLQPFVVMLFEELGLLRDNQFQGGTMRSKGVRLLAYLGWGTGERAEFSLQLEKHLCGVPTHEPLDSAELIERDMRECDSVLDAVIKHWTALKTTSRDGLREAFLRREGKLEKGDIQDRLIVERSSLDVLLDQVPWSFSVVRLPWMPQPLMVEWR